MTGVYSSNGRRDGEEGRGGGATGFPAGSGAPAVPSSPTVCRSRQGLPFS